MKNKFLRLIACLLVAATLLSITVVPTFGADNTEEPPAQTDESAPGEDGGENADAPAADENQEGDQADAPAEGEEPTEDAPAEGEDPAEDEPADEPADEEGSEDEDDEDQPAKFISDEEELARSEFVCENDNYAMYLDREFERIGLLVKETGFIHWSNCVNAMLDDATSKPALKQNRMSNIATKNGNATDLITSSYLYSFCVDCL